MKKGLKHFFSPAAVAEDQETLDASEDEDAVPRRKRRRKSTRKEDDFEYDDPPVLAVKRKSKRKNDKSSKIDDPPAAAKPKRKYTKRKLSENGDVLNPETEEPTIIVTSEESSEPVPALKANGKKKARLSSDKMTSSGSPENGEQGCSPSTANNSLLNYFSKVDKSDSWTTPKPVVLKVEADVHDPPPANPEEKKKRSPKFEELKSKLRISLGQGVGKNKKKTKNPDDYDVIICETVEEPVPLPVTDKTCVLPSTNDNPIIIDEPPMNGSTPMKPKTAKPTVKVKHDGTLASFFTIGNRIPKPMESDEQKQARINFLQSSSPASVKKMLASHTSEPASNPAPLPKVSHVLQKDPMNLVWNLSSVDLPLRPSDPGSVTLQGWSSVTSVHRHAGIQVNPSGETEAFDAKKELKLLKRESKDPVAVWYKDLEEMKKDKAGHMWSEKYRPSNVVHLCLSNVDKVNKFQSWLTNLKDSAKKDDASEYDSADDFVSGEDSCDVVSRTKRAALLTGPSGIGKTAIVYAVAQTLGYQVLELNASENRSGKRLVNEFSEALQSHKVETNKLTNFMDKNGRKKKTVPELPKRTLILIEDADLVFADNDDGFLSTVSSLAASSKRPVVFVANERGCKHLLSKIACQLELDIHFSSLRHERLNSWLRTICLTENMFCDPVEIERLSRWGRRCDVRKCLLQLEFSRAGKRDLTRVIRTDRRATRGLWNKLGDIDAASSKVTHEKCFELLTLVDVLFTTSNNTLRDDNPCQRHWDVDERDSTELTCPTDASPCLLTEEIACYSLSFLDRNIEAKTACFTEQSKREDSLADMELSLLSPYSLLSRSAVAMDLSPTLRNIARSEQVRLSTQTKRNNRYFHYLRPDHSSNIDFDKFSQPFRPTELGDSVDIQLQT